MDDAQSNKPQTYAIGQQRRGLLRVVLVAGDIAAFLVFAAIGRRSHNEAVGLLAWFDVVKTAAPFILGWLLVAPWTRSYRTDDYTPTQQANWWPGFAGNIALSWLIAWPIGLGLRALFLQRGIPFSFALITFATNLILLVGWRSLLAVALRRRASSKEL